MGYYADLIKEKKEKQNSIVKKGTFNKGTYTIDKTTGMFGRTVYIVHVHYEKGPSKDMTFGSDSFETLQDAQKYADRLNSKEEKDNEDSEYVKAIQKAERIINRMFQSRDKKEAKSFLEKIGWSVSTLGESPEDYARAIRRAVKNYPEKSLKILSNSKEEKDNEDPQIATLRRKALQKIKEAQKKADWYGDTVMQKFEKDITYAEEEDVPELAGALDRYLPKFEAKVKSFGNSDEEKGYYAKLAEEKESKKNSKSWRIEFLGNSYYIAKPADVDLALGKARQVLYIKEGQLDDEIRYAKESFAKFEKELSQIEKEVYQEFGK